MCSTGAILEPEAKAGPRASPLPFLSSGSGKASKEA